jgi:hypothetical protein
LKLGDADWPAYKIMLPMRRGKGACALFRPTECWQTDGAVTAQHILRPAVSYVADLISVQSMLILGINYRVPLPREPSAIERLYLSESRSLLRVGPAVARPAIYTDKRHSDP